MGSFVLLWCIGKAVLKGGLNALSASLPLGDVLFDVANGVADDWKKRRGPAERQADLHALAGAPAQQVREEVAKVVADVAADQPPEIQLALSNYLVQVPATICRTLRRPADRAGATAPAGLSLDRAEDLVPFLPNRLPRFKPGDRPAGVGDWELVELVGTGGFGEVWKARNPHLPADPPAALKFCLDPVAAGTLRNEAALLARVKHEGKHPGIVELRHTYLSADPPCLEYEYVEGGDLSGLIRDWHARGGPTPLQAAELILQLAEIVGHTHRFTPPLVHRDLKPANVLVQDLGDDCYRLKVTDYGIGAVAVSQAKGQATPRSDSRAHQVATAVRGSYSPFYASPQQARGADPDPRDDVHALGVIWYQLLTGDLGSGVPGGLQWLSDLKRRGMSEPMVVLLASCFEAQPSHRPENAAALAERLHALIRSETGSAGPLRGGTAGSEKPPVDAGRHRTRDAVWAVVVLACVAGALIAWRFAGTHDEEPAEITQNLIAELDSPDPTQRLGAVKRLEEKGSRARVAVPALARLAVSDPDQAVRSQARNALADLLRLQRGWFSTSDSSKKDFSAKQKQLDREARQSKDYDDVKALVRKLDDASETTRLGAYEALERMNKAHSLYAYRGDLVPPLARLAVQDPSEDLRERARRALGHVLGYEARR